MSQPIYKRILLKLSGEALQGEDGLGSILILDCSDWLLKLKN